MSVPVLLFIVPDCMQCLYSERIIFAGAINRLPQMYTTQRSPSAKKWYSNYCIKTTLRPLALKKVTSGVYLLFNNQSKNWVSLFGSQKVHFSFQDNLDFTGFLENQIQISQCFQNFKTRHFGFQDYPWKRKVVLKTKDDVFSTLKIYVFLFLRLILKP